ncbi:hypothetical protein ACFQJ5_13270 [Halomicroarcula sp. GCM10025324]|uniref:hypothetical protein n=1 Tax=Haloarcula TaxID=2237 RepID=UPI0023E8CEBF|nr:hypothetical protein [Halomicroarcula sp. ZS-22-S1]
MTTHETPCYYRVGPRQSDSPAIEDCVEGRLRLTEEGLVLGTDATSSDGSYTDRIDKHSNSAIRRLFGGHFDPQLFSFDDLPTDRTIAVPLTSIQDVQFLTWDGSHLRGADQTHGILVQTTAFGGDALLIQLGHGDRNRGSGTKRHRLFAQTLDALLAQSSPDRSAAGNGSVAAGTETVDASENSQVDWLDAPTAETTLVARNTSDETVTAHIGYREDEVVGGTYDVELDGNSTREWDGLSADNTIEVGAALGPRRTTARRFEVDGLASTDLVVEITPEEIAVQPGDGETVESTPASNQRSQQARSTPQSSPTTEAASQPPTGTQAATNPGGAASTSSVDPHETSPTETEDSSEGGVLKPLLVIVAGIGIGVFGSALVSLGVDLLIRASSGPTNSPGLIGFLEILPMIFTALNLVGLLVVLYGIYKLIGALR